MEAELDVRRAVVDDGGQGHDVIPTTANALETWCRSIDDVLPNGKMLSIAESPEDFAAVISRSNENEVVNAVIAEIRNRQTRLTVKQWCGCLALFVLAMGLVFSLWPRPNRPQIVSDDSSEMTLEPERYETKEVLEGALTGPEWEKSLKKLRTWMVTREDTDSYRRCYRNYLESINRVRNEHHGEQLPKRCYVEAVLKYLNGSERTGLETYARLLKDEGDAEYAEKKKWIGQAVECCNEMLHGADLNHERSENRLANVSFQKAQLLMYRWLVLNAEKSKGKKVSSFPDDKGGLGVDAREEAIGVIASAKKRAADADRLVRQCVAILVSDSSLLNAIWFNNTKYFRHDLLKAEMSRILNDVK